MIIVGHFEALIAAFSKPGISIYMFIINIISYQFHFIINCRYRQFQIGKGSRLAYNLIFSIIENSKLSLNGAREHWFYPKLDWNFSDKSISLIGIIFYKGPAILSCPWALVGCRRPWSLIVLSLSPSLPVCLSVSLSLSLSVSLSLSLCLSLLSHSLSLYLSLSPNE